MINIKEELLKYSPLPDIQTGEEEAKQGDISDTLDLLRQIQELKVKNS